VSSPILIAYILAYLSVPQDTLAAIQEGITRDPCIIMISRGDRQIDRRNATLSHVLLTAKGGSDK
jgi:hypothetical protein